MRALAPLLVLAACSGSAAPARAPVEVAPMSLTPAPDGPVTPRERSFAALERARFVWERLDQTESACPDLFDYHPRGGLRIFACHVFSLSSWAHLIELAPMRPFTSGPHAPGRLILDDPHQFGRYDPEFVAWLVDHAVPAAEDERLRELTQPLYDRYVRRLARIFAATHDKLVRDPECFRRERERYARLVAERRLPPGDYERYFFFMNPEFCGQPDAGFQHFADHGGFDGGYDGNVVKTAVAFWLRRAIDGTFDEFHRGLAQLQATYER